MAINNSFYQTIDQKRIQLEALRPIESELMAKINRKLRLDWNYHSNAMEGNTLTYAETRALILHDRYLGNKEGRFYREIQGHDDVIQSLENLVRDDYPLTQSLIRDLHKQMLGEPYWSPAITPDGQPTQKKIVPGDYKTTPNHVRLSNGEPFRYADPVEVNARMGDLLDWYRAEIEKSETHPVEIAALFHYRFILIHPFDDGNGRLARILMNLILMRARYVPAIIRLEDKPQYIDALRLADSSDDLSPFVQHVGENVLRVLDLMVRGARGENIEDLEDFDKRLSLIKRNLRKQELYIEAPNNEEVRLEVFETILRPLHEKILNKVNQLNDFFMEIEFEFVPNIANTNFQLIASTMLSMNNLFENSNNLKAYQAIKSDEEISFFHVYRLKKFRSLKNYQNFNLLFFINFEIRLIEIQYLIEYYSDIDDPKDCIEKNDVSKWHSYIFTELLNAPYAEALKPQPIDEWVRQISNELLDWIEKKIAE